MEHGQGLEGGQRLEGELRLERGRTRRRFDGPDLVSEERSPLRIEPEQGRRE